MDALIGLNLRKPSNNAFFCPVTRLHLTKTKPTGRVSFISKQIIMELKSGPYPGLLDLEGVIDLDTGMIKAPKAPVVEKEQTPVQKENIPVEEAKTEVVEATDTQVETLAVEETKEAEDITETPQKGDVAGDTNKASKGKNKSAKATKNKE